MNKLFALLALCFLITTLAWGEDMTDVIYFGPTGVSNGTSNYGSWTLSLQSTNHYGINSTAVYSGKTAGGNGAIQMKAGDGSGIVTTSSPGRLKQITLAWNNSTEAGRTVNVYGKKTSYGSPANLYDSSLQGELLGTIVQGTSTTLDIRGDYKYFGIRSNVGIVYLTSVTVVWEEPATKCYAVSCNTTENGTVVASSTSVSEGSVVTITANPNIGYTLSSVTITPSDNAVAAPTAAIDGNTASFTMPACDVTVDATFTEASHGITLGECVNCSITDFPETATSGSTVSFTVRPLSGRYAITSVTATNSNGDNLTLASPIDNGDGSYTYTFVMQAYDVVLNAACDCEDSNVFELVTDAGTLKPGDRIVLMSNYCESGYAMSTSQRTKNRGITGSITITDNKITPTDKTQIITLEGESGAWYFNVGGGYLYAASASENSLQTQVVKNDNAKATITMFGNYGAAQILFQGANSHNRIRFYNNAYSCYSGTSFGNDPYIFRRKDVIPLVNIMPEGGTFRNRDYPDGIEVTISCDIEGTTIYYTIDGSDPKDANGRMTYTDGITLRFDKTTTVRAIAYKDGQYSAEAEPRIYTFVTGNEMLYNLVTDATQLNESSVYMLVNRPNCMAMSAQETINRNAVQVQFVDETKAQVYGNSDVALFMLDMVGNQWLLRAMDGSGYLCVGADNTLLTQANADGNAEANIGIDAEHQAHISYVFDNTEMRYLRYDNASNAFSTYTSETANLPVSLYYAEATTLAWIEEHGQRGKNYTVTDDLQVVWLSNERAWARDLVDNINSVDVPEFDTANIDYLTHAEQQEGEWRQNNWVMLDLSPIQSQFDKFSSLTNGKHVIIKGGTLSGEYTDDRNYTIRVNSDAKLDVREAATNYFPNVYCAANYGPNTSGWQGTEYTTNRYWFMTPKVMEVATLTWSVWNGDGFFMPKRDKIDGQWYNQAGLLGGYAVQWDYNTSGEPAIQSGQAYKYLGVTMLMTEAYAGAPHRAASTLGVQEGSSLNTTLLVCPLNLTGSDVQVVTGVELLLTHREVVSVTYCDPTGRVSDRPLQGVNIIITSYNDGSTNTTKVIR